MPSSAPARPKPSRLATRAGALAVLLALGCAGSSASPEHAGSVVVQEGHYAPTTTGASGGTFVARETASADYGGASEEAGYGGADMAAPRAEAAPAMPGASASAPSAPSPASTSATITTTTTVEVTVDSLRVDEPPPRMVQEQAAPARLLTAATVGDHDRRGNYLEYLSRHGFEAQRLGLDMTRRVRFRIEDGQGQPVRDARIRLRTQWGDVQARTRADGRWDFFPGVDAPNASGPASLIVEAGGRTAELRVDVPTRGDGQDVVVRMPGVQARHARALDLAFLIDVTGSMEDELRYVNRELTDIVTRVRAESPETLIRVGAVFYRDRSDSVPLQRIAFTPDVRGFVHAMQTVHASGGGDYPEDLDAGLDTAVHGLDWSQDDSVKVLVVVADAPPQRYGGFTYLQAMRESSQRGIRILPVAASGADREVEFLFRAMGTYTAAPYVYLTDDSGIGAPHMEADTDRVAVEYFHDALTRLLVEDLRGRGMHEPGMFGEG
ncbi:MAG: VWA domain-containing protein [Sandaracinus sp.]|nr:VWA domain-containing protein [Sandaracinus sp.]MCB9621645.1 VWA domain-containing protein [Sandaracinus sp.]MCB9622097.1 VWA domain-containing protein [Sandaracinus sp.]MCB9630612.1 VWA domain-containing protein [Sandaracinus sp.]